MSLPLIAQIYCLCAGIGCLTVLVSALSGAMHQGAHGGHVHGHGHTGHSGHVGANHTGHTGHAGQGHASQGHQAGAHQGHAAKIGQHHGQGHGSSGSQHSAQGHGAQNHGAQSHGAQHHGQAESDLTNTGGLIRVKGHETHLSIEEDAPGLGIALLTYLNPNTIACFATWFGAVGIMLWRLTPLPLLFTLPLAIVGGTIGAKFMLWMVGSIGSKMYQSHTFTHDDIIGLPAEVSVPVQGTGMGEIVYVVGGTRHTLSARVNTPELVIARGTRAIICDVRDDVAYIEPWTDASLGFDEP